MESLGEKKDWRAGTRRCGPTRQSENQPWAAKRKDEKSWIHQKTAKLLHVMSKENEISKETKSTQPSESIPETTVRSSAQQKFPWHVECEVETTENGHNRGARSCSQPPTLDGLMLEKTGKKAQMYVRQNLMWFTVHEILTKRLGVNGKDRYLAFICQAQRATAHSYWWKFMKTQWITSYDTR